MRKIITDGCVSRLEEKLPWWNRIIWGIWFIDPPKNISLDGHRIEGVIKYTDTVITIYFGIVILALIYFIFRYRSRPGHKAVYDRGDTKKHVAMTVAMGLLVFFSIDVVIETMSFRDLKEAFWNFPQGDDVVRVEIMPQQFEWNFRYPGVDDRFGPEPFTDLNGNEIWDEEEPFTDLNESGVWDASDDKVLMNEMHIPVDRPVIIQVAPYDVIHSFFLPNFRIKIDATPGMVNTMWFQAKETGEYEIACSELCGNSHYKMKGKLVVESEDDYIKWLLGLESEGPRDDWYDPDYGLLYWGWEWKEVL
ncbi:MAG: cytochrome c oxidase subunit II [Fidelibacterota bacterium]